MTTPTLSILRTLTSGASCAWPPGTSRICATRRAQNGRVSNAEIVWHVRLSRLGVGLKIWTILHEAWAWHGRNSFARSIVGAGVRAKVMDKISAVGITSRRCNCCCSSCRGSRGECNDARIGWEGHSTLTLRECKESTISSYRELARGATHTRQVIPPRGHRCRQRGSR